jgi:hypothetical protein
LIPFTNGFVINLNFPLKIYEIIGIFLLSFYVLELIQRRKFSSCLPKEYVKKYFFIFFVLVAYAVTAGVYNVLFNPGLDGLTLGRSREFDFTTRILYLIFNGLIFALIISVRNEVLIKTTKYWFYGFYLSFAYHALTIVLHMVFGISFLLPGMSQFSFGSIMGQSMPRSGTFEEGNFASLFYLMTFLLASILRRKSLMFLSLLAVGCTLSTVGFLSLAAFCFWYFRKHLLYLPLIIISSVGLFFLILEKFEMLPGVSGAVRLNLILVGLDIYASNALLGVGVGGYGFHFPIYGSQNSFILFADTENRFIANNVFVEILSEYGTIGALVWIRFIISMFSLRYTHSVSRSLSIAVAGALGLHLCAFPTYNVSFLWLGTALLLKNISFTDAHFHESAVRMRATQLFQAALYDRKISHPK